MPEFEDNAPKSNQAQSYTPSKDASAKPRTRRRSGGFKTELAASATGSMGPVDPTEALKSEKLSGSGKPTEETTQSKEPRIERATRAKKPEATATALKESTAREPREDKPKANPQPSPETLAAITTVESRLAERKAEREARRAEREKNRPAKKASRPAEKKAAQKKSPPNRKGKQQETGILTAIKGFFGKLFGSKQKPAKKKSNNRRGANKRGKGGQNRSNGGKGQNRRGGKGGGKGRRQGGGNKRHTAESLSNES